MSEKPPTVKYSIEHNDKKHLSNAGHVGGMRSAEVRRQKAELVADSEEQRSTDMEEVEMERHGDLEDSNLM